MSGDAQGHAMNRDAQKRAAAEAAVALVQDGMVVGLGTGSTAWFAIDALARRVSQGLRILGIPTSERSARQARESGIPLTSFAEHRRIALTIVIHFPIVDEADFGRLKFETPHAALVDGAIRLDQPKFAGEDDTIQLPHPIECLADMQCHVGMHIGKQCGLETGGAQLVQPIGHIAIDAGPHLDIQAPQRADSLLVQHHVFRSNPRPVIRGTKIPPVVWIAFAVIPDGERLGV